MQSGRGFTRARIAAVAAMVGCGLVPAAHAAVDPVQDWPSYNRTLASDRFAPFAQIDRASVGRLQPVCTYDTGLEVSMQTGPIVIGRVLYATTEKDIFAIDAANCRELWRTKEVVSDDFLKVNRGAAFLDGRLFRGLHDGRVVAYDAASGRKLWETRIGDPAKGEAIPAAPIAWNGMVFIGNAGGDNYGVKGRMYALDAASGRIIWETYLVPREEDRSRPGTMMAQLAAKSWRNAPAIPIAGGATWTSYTIDAERGLLYVPGGNPAPDFIDTLRPGDNLFTNSVVVLDARTGEYRRHFSIAPEDFHDWDVAAAPILFTSRAGRRMMAVAPKDGQLRGYDLESGERRFATPVTTLENTKARLTGEGTRFCPGTQGGTEWNGPAYSPAENLVFTGAVDWCATVQIANDAKVASVSFGQPWSGSGDAKNMFGKFDPKEKWGGWITATDADSGEVRWRFRTPAPVLAAVTATGGGLVFSADMEGNAYAFDSASGRVLWQTRLEGAAGGGIISYLVDGQQRVAFVAGTNSPIWPVATKSSKIVVFGLPRGQ